MGRPINDRGVLGRFRPPPELPKSLLDLWPVVVTGTALWFVAFVALLVTGITGLWLWTTLAGGALGLLGLAVMRWQRSAAQRGSRGAQRGL
ncbi:Protein of unknown function [Amycolatopsis marina]|uniref:DUF2530 domain-containing protein n=1 Tax=Amycolatopsis marina TaxID=490629 RepID=A0A1I1CJM0_9PSEU|nr:DUF2530 domain-containing protein [Amycolatopsis marina]SFB62242.1 Protein of unknown function [Amycolatopsis marina]